MYSRCLRKLATAIELTKKRKWNIIAEKLLNLLLAFSTLPCLFLLFLLRPFILVRVGNLFSERIGHLAMNNELYLCERDLGLHPQRVLDIFYDSGSICNYQLRKMWEDHLTIHPFAQYIDRGISLYIVFKKHRINTSSRNRYDIFENCRPHLTFTQDDFELGKSSLEAMGVNSDYICVLCRDSAYLKKRFPGFDFSYHDYRDVDINTYQHALAKLADRGYYVLRTGSVVKTKSNWHHDRIIDYATNGMRTEFLDIYLPAQCRFFMSTGTGLDAVAKIFRRPILYTNFIPLEYIRSECSHDLCIPKKLWIRDERRFMTFREILESGVGRFLHKSQYEKFNLEIIDNTREEIEAVSLEMDERLKGRWQTTEEDEELQRRFWSLFTPSEINRAFRSHIGTSFLHQNRELLE